MNTVLYGWPWLALIAGAAGLAALLASPRAGLGSRWRDPSWLVCLMLPVYMLHQFEEHGINLRGERYHFLVELCAKLGRPELLRCPANPAFILAVNCGGVWISGLLAIAFRRRNPMVGACAMGIPLVNAVLHVGPAAGGCAYNSGLATAAVLFVPMCAWTLFQLRRAGLLGRRELACVVGSGLLVHAVLLTSLLGREQGLWGQGVLIAINIIDGAIPVAFGALARREPRRLEPG